MKGLPPGAVRRLGQIVEALMLEGLEVPVARLRLTRCASWRCRLHCTWQRWTGRRPTEHPWPLAVRDAMIRLGPAFVKIGQLLSVRGDLVPEPLVASLRSLQAEVPSLPFAELQSTIEASLDGPVDTVFDRFDRQPLAAGSIAQVHEAVWADGTRVAVKVKRPGIEEVMRRDLDLLIWLAQRLERHLPEAHRYRPVRAAEELKRYTLQELDFRNEGTVCSQVREGMAEVEGVRIPRVLLATDDVLVLEFVEGFPMDDTERLRAEGIDRQALVRRGMEAVLFQIFDLGLFHADPHPGNLHVTPEGDLVLLDFGIFGRLDERLQRYCALLVWTLSRGDAELASHFLLQMADLEPDADVPGFRRAVEARYRAWHGKAITEYGFARLVYEELTLGARHGVVFPPDMVLFGKAMVTMEGVVAAVDPDFDLSAEARPYLDSVRGRLFGPDRLVDSIARSLPLWWDLAERLPVRMADLLDRRMRRDTRSPVPSPPPSRLPGALLASTTVLAGLGLALGAVPPAWGGLSLPAAALLVVGLGGGWRHLARRESP